jgi:Ca2+-transporting ATPase
MIFMGTEIAEGSGLGVIMLTGLKTQMGQIAHLIASADEDSSPLQQKLEKLGFKLGLCGVTVVYL